MDISKPLPLTPFPQHYVWGKTGQVSIIAKLIHASDLNQHFAELWFGAHPKLPSAISVDCNNHPFDSLISKHSQEILGKRVSEKFKNTLPFLFKILNIGSPLSIQAHPDKELAIKLHTQDPQHYPDADHKPELALAISPAQMLYGFRSAAQIKENISTIPELGFIIKRNAPKSFEQLLSSPDNCTLIKTVYSTMYRAPATDIEELCLKLYNRLGKKGATTSEDKWILKLKNSFPKGDVGLFCFYLHNLCELKPGEAIYIQPNTPHAYLDGDLIECMANSDNTVRGGLTVKFVDVEALLGMLDFRESRPAVLSDEIVGPFNPFRKYNTPAEEFSLESFSGSLEHWTFYSDDSLKLLFCLEGECKVETENTSLTLNSGQSALIPAVVPSYSLRIKEAKVFRVGVP